MSLKTKRLLIRLIVHLSLLGLLMMALLISNNTGNISVMVFSALLILLYLATMRINPLPKILEKKCLKEVQCVACGEVIQLWDIFSCSCGWVSWKTRYALDPCEHCGKVFAFLVCPRCQTSIPC